MRGYDNLMGGNIFFNSLESISNGNNFRTKELNVELS